MRYALLLVLFSFTGIALAEEPILIAKPDAFKTLINPSCSHCVDEAKRRATDLKDDDRILTWTRGYSEGGAIPFRFFLAPYRVISDSYGVFVYDPDAGFARGFTASYEFQFHGWRNGIMVMKHKDGTLFSSLSGLAFDGPRKGTRLEPVPTLVSDWGFWLKNYPNAVAYRMFDKYIPVDLPTKEHPDSLKTRPKADQRLKADESVLGVWTGKISRAYPISILEKQGFIEETLDGERITILWEPKTKTASAYRLNASQPRKFKAPAPDEKGISSPEVGQPMPEGAAVLPSRKLNLRLAAKDAPHRFQDLETKSYWDVAGRCGQGELKGWTLEWVDAVQVKWFAWAAEYPATTLFEEPKTPAPVDPKDKVKEIAGTAEFLRLLPKPFATIKSLDAKRRTVELLLDGEKEAKVWPLEPDAEVKRNGWWGRLEQFQPGERVWVWLKLDRKKKPVSILMLADEISEFDMHASLIRLKEGVKPKYASPVIDAKRDEQRLWLRERWTEEGLPGTLTFLHLISGELEISLDHEAMRWGRSLKAGHVVQLQDAEPIKGVVKSVQPWRERTVVRLVVGELESSELKMGQRIRLKMTPITKEIEDSPYPSDIDQPRSRSERIEWSLASTYCTCGVSNDVCTGHFYTLSSCNPNGCGMPNHRREELAKMIDQGLTDRQIFDALLKESGPLLVRPHLKP